MNLHHNKDAFEELVTAASVELKIPALQVIVPAISGGRSLPLFKPEQFHNVDIIYNAIL